VHELRIKVVDDALVGAELVFVLADRLPAVEAAVPSRLKVLQIGRIRVVLVRSFDLLLIDRYDVEVHLANFSTAIFKPINVEELIQIKLVLVRIIFEKFGLSDDVVLILLFFLLIDEVRRLGLGTLSHVWRHTNEVSVNQAWFAGCSLAILRLLLSLLVGLSTRLA
jgi:hypothetical protein